mgnify:CR=1 FL=1
MIDTTAIIDAARSAIGGSAIAADTLSTSLAPAAPTALSIDPNGPWWVALIPGLPILGVLIATISAIAGVRTKLPAFLTVGCLAGSFGLTLLMWQHLQGLEGDNAFVSVAWEWFSLSWGSEPGQQFSANFGFYVDSLTCLWMLFVTGLATLIALYASEYMSHDVGSSYCRFFAAFNLFVFSMACLVMGSNLLMLFLGWEGVGLCSYLLIGYYFKKPSAVFAAKKAFIVNRIGDLGLLLGIFLTFAHFGTIEYAELFPMAQPYIDALVAGRPQDIPLVVEAIPLLLMIGAFGKSAQFPLYVWLPDAMEGPTPVSALIHAATMVTAGVYLIARFYPLFLASEYALPIVAWIGAITALLAATIAMAQYDIKRIMAYSTVSQLGYMFCGLAFLSSAGGAFHVLTHAFFKATLFLCCGAVMHGFAGQLDLRKLSGVTFMKGWLIVGIAMLVGCLNLAGFPFTAGYFSKDMILAEAFVTPGPGYSFLGFVLLLTAGLTAYYTFRVFFRVFVGPKHYEPGDELHDDAHADDHADDDAHTDGSHGHGFHPHAPGWAVNSVLAILAVASIAAAGLYFVKGPDKAHKGWVGSMLEPSTAAMVVDDRSSDHPVRLGKFVLEDFDADARPRPADLDQAADDAHGKAGTLFGQDPHKIMYYVSGVIGAIGIGIAFLLHFLGRTRADRAKADDLLEIAPIRALHHAANRKWYVDEFYDAVIRIPLRITSKVFHIIDQNLLDGAFVNGAGNVSRIAGRSLQPAQNGKLHGYAFGMAGGVALLLLVVLLIGLL